MKASVYWHSKILSILLSENKAIVMFDFLGELAGGLIGWIVKLLVGVVVWLLELLDGVVGWLLELFCVGKQSSQGVATSRTKKKRRSGKTN